MEERAPSQVLNQGPSKQGLGQGLHSCVRGGAPEDFRGQKINISEQGLKYQARQQWGFRGTRRRGSNSPGLGQGARLPKKHPNLHVWPPS